MKHLRDTYGFDEFYFCDETFTLDAKHARQLCEGICQELPGIRWRGVTRVDRIDDELAVLMHRAGCYEIGFGVEVGNDRVLQENTKDATVCRNLETIRRIQEIGIMANALTILGMPQEDHADIRRTFSSSLGMPAPSGARSSFSTRCRAQNIFPMRKVRPQFRYSRCPAVVQVGPHRRGGL